MKKSRKRTGGIPLTYDALKALLDSLSLDEKVGQLCQAEMASLLTEAGSLTGPAADMHLTREQIYSAGSLICGAGADPEAFSRVVEDIRSHTPHGIPPLIMSDVIHGMRTVFPIPLAMGGTFDEEEAETMARVSAEEAAACGIHVTFAPMLDGCRDPRWGRGMESPGESPALCGAMGAAMVRGFHGKGLAEKDSLACCAKHFAGYALVEAGKEYAPVDVSRTEMYNTYLPPFKAALDAGCDMVMPAFTPIDRVPAAANRWLLRTVLRERWGFEGMTISDWDAPGELIKHGLAADKREAALLCFRAGLDMDMMSFAYLTELKGLVEDGTISMAELDTAVMRVLALKNRLGLFERPCKATTAAEQMAARKNPAHRAAALRAAIKSCVLLKNEGALPLHTGVKLAICGSHADTGRLLGSWQADGREEETPTLRQAFARDRRVELTGPEAAEVILFATGEDQGEVGEAGSKVSPVLPASERETLRQLSKMGKPIVMVLFCGRPLMIGEDIPLCGAVLNAWFPGSEGAEAIRRLLMGDENPSGHLSMTFPRSLGQVPIHHDALSTGRPCGDTFIPFASAYRDEKNSPLYPFGFGLSYTSFRMDQPHLSGPVLSEDAPVTITAEVTNDGGREGATVLQLYAHGRHGAQMQPLRRLLAWKRVCLKPGETAQVSFTLTKDMLAAFDAEGCTVPAEGVYDLALGEDSAAPWNASVSVK